MTPSTQSERVLRAVLTLTMAGSTNSTTDVVLDADEIAHVSGLDRDTVDRELDALIAAGGADAL